MQKACTLRTELATTCGAAVCGELAHRQVGLAGRQLETIGHGNCEKALARKRSPAT